MSFFIILCIGVSYLSLTAVVALVRWLTRINYHLDEDQKREANRHKFVIIGAGFSGLVVGYFFRLMGLNFVIIEKGSDVGGTWYWNRYLGVACDVASHLYSYSHFLNSNWSNSYPAGAQMQNYLLRFYNYAMLNKYTKFNTEVTKAVWNWQLNRWEITTKFENHEEKSEYNWLICCAGGLHQPNVPKFGGDADFTGPKFHTAQWNQNVNLEGKRIGIIGTGASAIQVLPQLINDSKCKQVVQFQRTPPYSIPRMDFTYPSIFKTFIAIYPFGILYRWVNWIYYELIYIPFYFHGGVIHRLARRYWKWNLNNSIKNPELVKKLTPNYTLGCKRILISDTYYSSMNSPIFHLEVDPISNFTTTGIQTSNAHHELDIIIYATGFRINSYDFIVNHNSSLKKWREDGEVSTYFGTLHSILPNYAIFFGPMTFLGHNSIIFIIECQLQMLINAIRQMLDRKAECVLPKEAVIQEHIQEWRERADSSIWTARHCRSWYQQGTKDASPTAVWPGSTIEYYFRTRNISSDNLKFF